MKWEIKQTQKQLKLFFKNKIFKILYSLILLSTLALILFFILIGAEIFYTFHTILRYLFFESLIFMIMTYMFLTMDRKSKIAESLQVIAHNKKQYMVSSITVLIVLLVAYNLLLLVLLFMNAIVIGELSVLLMLLKYEYLFNLLLPQFVYFMITIMLTQFDDMRLSSIFFIIVTILMSPFMNYLEWKIKPIIPIDVVINALHLPFSIFLQHADVSVDYLYGFQNEPYKIMVCLFWMGLSIVIMNRDKIKRNKWKLGLISIVLAILFAGIYYPQNIYRVDRKWDGIYSDYNYYKRYEGKSIINKEKSDEYIDEYHLDVSIKNELNIDGTIHLKSKKPKEDYVLTLYHAYKIKSIESTNLLSYKQEGDYVYLTFDQPTDSEIVKMTYSGYHDTLYSNSQATQLPGFFPWYPMEGHKNVYFYNNQTTGNEYGINPYNHIESAKFYIQIDAKYPFISNLSETRPNYFEGESDSVTLIGGNVKPITDKQETSYQVMNYFPYHISHIYSTNDMLNDINERIEQIKDGFRNIFNQELDVFDNKKIIVFSNAMHYAFETGYAEFDDYILVTDGSYIRMDTFIAHHLVQRTDMSSEFYFEIIISDYEKSNDKILLNDLMNRIDENIVRYTQSELEQAPIIRQSYIELKELFKGYIEKYGEEGTMKKIGDIILGGEK